MNFQEEHNKKVVEALEKNPALIEDKLWRLENLYWIVTKDGTKEIFKMNRAQKDFAHYLLAQTPFHRHIILKSRQLGFTTFIDIYILDEILFRTNREALVVAHKVEDAREIFDRKIDFAIRNMAEDVKSAFFKLQRNSAKKIQVVIDYGPQAGSTSSIQVSSSGRSGTFFYVHISEFAKMCVQYPKNAERVEADTFPAVPFDGFIFIESTAEGMAGRYYEMFQQAWMEKSKMTPMKSRVQFMAHFYNWQYDDMEMKKITENIPVKDMEIGEIDWGEYQKEHRLTDIEITYYYMKWLQLGGKNGTDSVHKLRQEYPTTPEEAFLSTGQTYFPTTKVMSMLEKAEKGTRGEVSQNENGKVVFQELSTGNLEVFEKPVVGERYVIGGDTAEGLADGDAQVLYVIKHSTGKCVAIYKSQEPPDEFATTSFNVGKYYNYALLGIEVNKDGLWVNDALNKASYPNLYARKNFDDITQKVTLFFGWKTTSATRPFALAALKAVFLRMEDGFPGQILGEMVTFIRNTKGRPEALKGKHDDIIMAASIAYAILQEYGKYTVDKKPGEGFSHMKAIFGEKQSTDEVLSFPMQ